MRGEPGRPWLHLDAGACAELTAGTCYWAMMNTGNRSGFTECFAEEVDDESCGARFMRCAWGL